jgi:hypothetical protein
MSSHLISVSLILCYSISDDLTSNYHPRMVPRHGGCGPCSSCIHQRWSSRSIDVGRCCSGRFGRSATDDRIPMAWATPAASRSQGDRSHGDRPTPQRANGRLRRARQCLGRVNDRSPARAVRDLGSVLAGRLIAARTDRTDRPIRSDAQLPTPRGRDRLISIAACSGASCSRVRRRLMRGSGMPTAPCRRGSARRSACLERHASSSGRGSVEPTPEGQINERWDAG